jgi:ATP synthase protein I
MKGPLMRTLLKASTVGLTLVVSTFVGLAIGVFLDRVFGTRPWLTIIFLLVGIGTGFRDLYLFAVNQGQDDTRDE